MRFDVLNLILGWTLVALTIPLLLCVVATGYLDNWELAIRAFSIPAGLSLFIGSMMLRFGTCLLYTSPSPRDGLLSRMPSSA